jgi:hypothetical protein
VVEHKLRQHLRPYWQDIQHQMRKKQQKLAKLSYWQEIAWLLKANL